MCSEKENRYDDTVDTSREMSMQKAIGVLMEEIEDNKPAIERPIISPKNGILKILCVLMMLGTLVALSLIFDVSLVYVSLLAVMIVVIEAKKVTIWSILLYQKYAPESLRAACLFEPSCSNYMLLAIEKYGYVRGVIKGVKRLFRCHPPYGGIDMP